jgi:hypothetical protein
MGQFFVALREAAVALTVIFTILFLVTQPVRIAQILRSAGIKVIDVGGVRAELEEAQANTETLQAQITKGQQDLDKLAGALATIERNLTLPSPPSHGGGGNAAPDSVRIAVAHAAGTLRDSKASFVSASSTLARNVTLHRELLQKAQQSGK